MKNAVFRKAMEYVKNQRNHNCVITETRRNYLVSETKYHTTKFFTENLLAIKIAKKTNINE